MFLQENVFTTDRYTRILRYKTDHTSCLTENHNRRY